VFDEKMQMTDCAQQARLLPGIRMTCRENLSRVTRVTPPKAEIAAGAASKDAGARQSMMRQHHKIGISEAAGCRKGRNALDNIL
tara:strand:+ start:656 stop:907 length:252 start_codon:yes stop_codon:yes gene_type:complete